MRKFGLIGKKLGHSFSKKYFTEKFAREGIADSSYALYELPQIEDLLPLLQQEPELVGLNVTVPYKEQVLPLLDALDKAAARIGAVNTIKIENGRTTGYNTDYTGFNQTMERFYPPQVREQALVLGTGGAAKAVWAALEALGIPFKRVSRQENKGQLTYEQLTPEVVGKYNLLINTTPLGMYPDVQEAPALSYKSITARHYAYDLVYNPEQTLFLQKCAANGAKTINGLPMLYAQADSAWHIWSSR
ncbi:shikimate dehydrogenase family protein [Pontibacter akesuensis]|uniref:Shikimate dehydrogenase n=1 Tax=Pontibacter akesuensis TaxID=388950 RepID=A0A1I7JJZ4_9BACT|nr:shikimate dehydrogenase [Pontibacter akesuensis]GHA69442.1 shikimate 5-dehydrogenase [Pontibacter akesuensis]SFU85480.1 shikimate dehydrogenase [Pontibacter akesuensis]